jgi:hypothetical protein
MRHSLSGRSSKCWLRFDGFLVASSFLLLTGCANLPDTRPFTDATINLRGAVASSGVAVVGELGRTRIEGVSREAKALEDAWKERQRLFSALIDYANSLQAIVDSANHRTASINALCASASKLAEMANVLEPGAGEAGSAVSKAAAFVYAQIAKARAASSLERALVEIQPAIERIAQIMSDQMQPLDDLIRTACQAQRDELRISNQSKVAYRASLVASREKWMDKIRSELDSGRKPSEITQVDEIKRLEELLAATDSWNGFLQDQLRAIAERERLSRLLISETKSALVEWAAAHARMLTAIRTRRMLSAAELVQAAERIRGLGDDFGKR